MYIRSVCVCVRVLFFPESEFSDLALLSYCYEQETLRIVTVIIDVDEDPISHMFTFDTIAIALFHRQGNLGADFSNVTLAGNLLELRLQYRLICTPGFCGPTCSQTTGCSPYPPACPPEQPVCDINTPCINGGTCQVRQHYKQGYLRFRGHTLPQKKVCFQL